MFGFRFSMTLAVVVLSLTAPSGILLGLVAGYHEGTWVDTLVMRIADMFIAVPPLVLALSICSILPPNIINAMMAVSLMWWPWYARLVYNATASLKNEYFVQAAEITGASRLHIMFREILPNALGPILTKLTLDVGWVILIGASLSFVGLGAQPPTPDLGTMVAEGSKYLPEYWWISIFPALAISFIILGFNLLGDGIKDALSGG
jgi:peptide/nickel transport system permease protein